MSTRVRAILLTQNNTLLLIKRVRPDTPPYWVSPGGGVEPDDVSDADALRRELSEELGISAIIGEIVLRLPGSTEHGMVTNPQLFFLCEPASQVLPPFTGPEFASAERGQYHLDEIPFTVDALEKLNLLPPEFKSFLISEHSRLSTPRH
jgi:8-oxo-dGTP pyrophosphatase MutT (NUDIX family)